MTPPMSPGHSDLGDDTIVVDSEPRYSGPAPHGPHSTAAPTTAPGFQELGDAGGDQPAQVAPVPQRPLRLLEDEQVHLQRSGLRLTDFEVRGTLGL